MDEPPVATLNRRGSSFDVKSVQASGTDTVAPPRALVENAATDVFVRLLRM